jgi:phospholipase/carboxylesterase
MLGGLDTVVIPGTPDGPTVVMMHGYGADAWDLVPLAQVLPVPPGTTWLFPNAPLEVPLGPHMTGRAWFAIDMAALEAAMMRGQHRDLSRDTPPALEHIRELLMAMLTEAGATWSKTILAGFSQGAMVATAAALRAHRQPLGLVVLSGTLVDAESWAVAAKKHKGLPVFQSHGTRDPLLDVQAARKLHRLFDEAGMPTEYHEFIGGHEIPQPVLDRLGAWLAQRQ